MLDGSAFADIAFSVHVVRLHSSSCDTAHHPAVYKHESQHSNGPLQLPQRRQVSADLFSVPV